jgi:outer membrane protein assembly factor BamB
MALDRKTGETVWERVLCEAVPHERGHRDASQASNSPVTDGEHVIAHFGSRGVYGLDLQGRVLWEKQLGTMETRRGFGEGSSPALHGDTVVVNWDHEGQSFVVALDKRSGKQRWRVDRDEKTSWTTPVVVTVDGKPQVIVSGTNRIRGYDLATGKVIWECGGMTGNVVPTPVLGDGLIYFASGFRGSALLAVRYAGAKGDITDTPAVVWAYEGKGTPYVPSPVLCGDYLYFLQQNRAALTCVDARTGKVHYARQRLEDMEVVYASLVCAKDRVYVVGQEGTTAVLRNGPDFALLASNALDDSFSASPAIVGDEIFLRGLRYLYCIAEQ